VPSIFKEGPENATKLKPAPVFAVVNYILIVKDAAMKKDDKFSPFEIVGLVAIILIFLYFPYKMITEHELDSIAMGYYHNGR
jgi:hypothetical protein